VPSKLAFTASVLAVLPRIRLHRSFDQRSHSYTGYVLRLDGQVGGTARAFVIAIGKSTQEKHSFRPGDKIIGEAEPVVKPETEVADLYKVTKLKVVERPAAGTSTLDWRSTCPRSLSRPRSPPTRRQNLRVKVLNLHLGM